MWRVFILESFSIFLMCVFVFFFKRKKILSQLWLLNFYCNLVKPTQPINFTIFIICWGCKIWINISATLKLHWDQYWPFDITFVFWMNKRLYWEKEQLQEKPASPLIIRLKIGGRCLKQRNQKHFTLTTI